MVGRQGRAEPCERARAVGRMRERTHKPIPRSLPATDEWAAALELLLLTPALLLQARQHLVQRQLHFELLGARAALHEVGHLRRPCDEGRARHGLTSGRRRGQRAGSRAAQSGPPARRQRCAIARQPTCTTAVAYPPTPGSGWLTRRMVPCGGRRAGAAAGHTRRVAGGVRRHGARPGCVPPSRLRARSHGACRRSGTPRAGGRPGAARCGGRWQAACPWCRGPRLRGRRAVRERAACQQPIAHACITHARNPGHCLLSHAGCSGPAHSSVAGAGRGRLGYRARAPETSSSVGAVSVEPAQAACTSSGAGQHVGAFRQEP